MYEIRNGLKETWKDFAKFFIKTIALPYNIEIQGKENIPEGRAILAANHASFGDPVFLVAGLNIRIYFLAKHFIAPTENFDESFYGRLLNSVDQIMIKKGVIDKYSLKKAVAVLDNDNENNKLGIFPEGTRSLDGRIGKINDGAARIAYISKAPIVPVGIQGTYEIWPRHKKFPKLYGKIKLNAGKPLYIDYNTDKRTAIKNLTDVLEIEISRLLCI